MADMVTRPTPSSTASAETAWTMEATSTLLRSCAGRFRGSLALCTGPSVAQVKSGVAFGEHDFLQ